MSGDLVAEGFGGGTTGVVIQAGRIVGRLLMSTVAGLEDAAAGTGAGTADAAAGTGVGAGGAGVSAVRGAGELASVVGPGMAAG